MPQTNLISGKPNLAHKSCRRLVKFQRDVRVKEKKIISTRWSGAHMLLSRLNRLKKHIKAHYFNCAEDEDAAGIYRLPVKVSATSTDTFIMMLPKTYCLKNSICVLTGIFFVTTLKITMT